MNSRGANPLLPNEIQTQLLPVYPLTMPFSQGLLWESVDRARKSVPGVSSVPYPR
jgi:hypothetical protein